MRVEIWINAFSVKVAKARQSRFTVYRQSFYRKACGQVGGHFTPLFEAKLLKVIQKFVKARKSVKNLSKIIIMKFEAVAIVLRMMWVVTINYKSMPGLTMLAKLY